MLGKVAENAFGMLEEPVKPDIKRRALRCLR